MFLTSKYNPTSIFVFFYLLTSIPLAFILEWNTSIVIICAFNFLWFGLASSFYYHRVLTHRAMKLNIFVEYFFLVGGLASLSGDPVKWAIMHRYHHQHSDFDDDVHSPKHGFFWAYYGWLMKKDLVVLDSLKHTVSDLTSRPHLSMWSKTESEGIFHVLLGALFFYFGGVNYFVLGFLLPIFLSYNCHWMLIASLCHIRKFGEEKHNLGDNSRNIAWLSLISFGESMHNNHHRYPRAANLSSSWKAIDLSGIVGRLLIKCGLASDGNFVNHK